MGYRSGLHAMHLTERELAHHGALFGGPGSGKTTLLELILEARAGQEPVVMLDPKGSRRLADRVRALGGQVWTVDGKLPVDLLDPRPWQVPDLLLEAEDYAAEARVFRDAAHQRALWAAWALALRDEPMDLARLRELLDRKTLCAALAPFQGKDQRIGQWLAALKRYDGTEESGVQDLQRSLGTLLDGVAMRGSLATGPGALRLEDVIETNGLVLFSLDVADYPHATRKMGAWVLLAMQRLARTLPEQHKRCLLLVDEVGALGPQAKHLRGLVGRARESGLAVVVATQGPSDLEAVDRALLSQVLQDTAWQAAFRQGSPRDAEQMVRLFGQQWVEDVAWRSDGMTTTRRVERPRVSIDEWMNGLGAGDAWVRVAPIDRGWRQVRVRVAMPTARKLVSETGLGNSLRTRSDTFSGEIELDSGVVNYGEQFPNRVSVRERPTAEVDQEELPGTGQPAATGNRGLGPERVKRLAGVPPECPEDLLERIGADVLAKVERRFVSERRELGPCLIWREGEPTLKDGLYGRIYDPKIKRSDAAHLVVWRRVYGPIPEGLTVDHLCWQTLCQRPDHFELVMRGENTRRMRQRRKEMRR